MEGSLLCSSLPENMPGKRETFYFVLKLPVREKWNCSPGRSIWSWLRLQRTEGENSELWKRRSEGGWDKVTLNFGSSGSVHLPLTAGQSNTFSTVY